MSIAVGSTSQLALANRTNSTIPAPSGIVDGNALVCVFHAGDGSGLPPIAVTPPDVNWVEATNSPAAAAFSTVYTVSTRIFVKIASSESGNYTFSHAAADTEAFMYRLTGVDTSNPFDVAAVVLAYDGTTNGQTTGYGSLTTVTDGAFLIYAESDNDGPGSGTVSGSTPSITVRQVGSVTWVGDGTLATAGATGARTRSNGNSGANFPWASIVVAIRPATASTTALQAASKVTLRGTAGITAFSPPTSAPILISTTSTAFNTATTPKTASGIIVQSGDVILAHGVMESANGSVIGISTASGNTSPWALLEDVPNTIDSGQSYLRTWWTTATANGTISVAFACPGTTQAFGGIVKIYRNASGVGAAESANNSNGSGAPSVSITTTQANSALDYASADWNATAGSVTFTSSAGVPAQDVDTTVSGLYRIYSSHLGDAGSDGAKTIGISSPSTQRFVASAVEVLGTGNAALLTARAVVTTRAAAAAQGRTPLTAKTTSSMRGRASASGRVLLASKAAVSSSATLVRSVALAFQTRFFPAMRGTLTTTASLGSSAGTAAMFRMSGAAAARTGLAGKATTASRVAGGVGGRTMLSGLAKTASRAASTFSGTVVLAIQTRFFPAMRGALNAAVVPTALALSASSAIISRARSTIAGRTSLTAQTTITSQAPGRMSAIAVLASRSAAQVKNAAVVTAKSALSAAVSIETASRGVVVGIVSLGGRTASAVSARATPSAATAFIARTSSAIKASGTTAVQTSLAALAGRTAVVAKAVGSITARTALAGKSALQAKASTQGASLRAVLVALTKVASMARSATAATAALTTSGAAKIGTTMGATFSGTVGLAARAKVAAAAGIGEAFNPLSGRAMVRASARALLSILRPVISPPAYPRPDRRGRLRASLERAFGEEFDIEPMTAGTDVNSRVLPDISRDPLIGITGVWQGPTTTRTPTARGALQDDNAHNWNVSFPSARFDSAAVASVRKWDKLTRQLDGSVWWIERVVPDGFGRTTLQLTSRKRAMH